MATLCKVAVPDWYISTTNLGHCRKYRPYHNEMLEQDFMLCSDTKLPCPLNGVNQFPVDEPKMPRWMKETRYAI